MSDQSLSGVSASSSRPGPLLLIGGAASGSLLELVSLVNRNGLIVVVPHASRAPRQSANKICNDLRKAGATNLLVVMPRQDFVIPASAAAVYLGGGDQNLLVRRLGKEGARELRRFHESGGVVSGTSAGAAAIAACMIGGGMDDRRLEADKLEMVEGLGLISVTVDTHFNERGRFARGLVAVVRRGGETAIGLDEDTGVIIRFEPDGSAVATVCGAGYAFVFSATENFASVPESLGAGDRLEQAVGVEVSVLRSGSAINLGAESETAHSTT